MENKQKFFNLVSQLVLVNFDCSREVSEFIAAQSCLETGYGTSDICLTGNNLFGMRFPVHRICTTFNKYKNHCLYSSFESSVIDYFLWLVFFGFTKSDLMFLSAFCKKLRKTPYNPSSDYVDTIHKIYCSMSSNSLFHE